MVRAPCQETRASEADLDEVEVKLSRKKMNITRTFLRRIPPLAESAQLGGVSRTIPQRSRWICPQCSQETSPARLQRRGYAAQPADNPEFVSIVDNPPQLIRAGKRHGWGLAVLGMGPFRKCPSSAYMLSCACSRHSHHSFCSRFMASPALRMEDRAHRAI